MFKYRTPPVLNEVFLCEVIEFNVYTTITESKVIVCRMALNTQNKFRFHKRLNKKKKRKGKRGKMRNGSACPKS